MTSGTAAGEAAARSPLQRRGGLFPASPRCHSGKRPKGWRCKEILHRLHFHSFSSLPPRLSWGGWLIFNGRVPLSGATDGGSQRKSAADARAPRQ